MTSKNIKSKWLRFTEETNALDYLIRVEEFVKQTISDIKAWKWVVLSLHGALYGFAISACKGSDYTSVIKRTKKGYERLINLNEALKMCQDPIWMGTMYNGVALNLTESQKDSIRILKESLRNNFEHYIPRGWSIEIHGLPHITMDILDIIRFLSVETLRYQNLNQRQRRKIKSIVYQCKRLLKKHLLFLELH